MSRTLVEECWDKLKLPAVSKLNSVVLDAVGVEYEWKSAETHIDYMRMKMQTEVKKVGKLLGLPIGETLETTRHLPRYLVGHRVEQVPIMPGMHYVSLLLDVLEQEGVSNIGDEAVLRIDNLVFHLPLPLDESDDNKVTLKIFHRGEGECDVVFFGGESQLAELSYRYVVHEKAIERRLSNLHSVCDTVSSTGVVDGASLYEKFHKNGNQYEGVFRSIESVEFANNSSTSTLVVESTESDYETAMLDGSIQALAAVPHCDSTFMITGVERIELYRGVPSRGVVHARLSDDIGSEGTVAGELELWTNDGQLVSTFQGVKIKYLSDGQIDAQTRNVRISVSSTFTAEPVQASIEFWSGVFGGKAVVSHAPYNQVFQQFYSPASVLRHGENDCNYLLVRPEDWVQVDSSLSLQVSQARKDELLASHKTYFLDNAIEIAHLNQYETEYVQQEIFSDLAYLKHGVEINDGDCIVDIGANIGLFMLFAHSQAKDIEVFCFEPSPPVFEILSANAELYGENVHLFNLGVAEHKSEAQFTFYEKSSVFSTFSADKNLDETAIRAVIENMVRGSGSIKDDPAHVDQLVEELIADRLSSTDYISELISLSDVIDEQGIDKIDLLKLDAEKSELAVIRGIRDDHWPLIRQIVLEVHDTEGAVISQIKDILRDKGFELKIEEEEFLRDSGLYNIFATRKVEVVSGRSPANPSQQASNDLFQSKLERVMSEFAQALSSFASSNSTPTVVALCPSSENVSRVPAISDAIAKEQQRLQESVSGIGNVAVISSGELLANFSGQHLDSLSDKVGKIPYTAEFFTNVGTSLTRVSQALQRVPKKVLVLDCDNTLWDGVCGEVGAEGVVISEAFQRLQQFVRQQVKKGVLVCLCSKNSEDDVWSVFEKNPDMVLQRSDITSYRINWEKKSSNLASIAQELNLGIDSFIFLDDNPIECAEVRAALPQVLTLQLPNSHERIGNFLSNVWEFDRLRVTEEDHRRTEMYQQNVQREVSRANSVSLQQFLDELQLNIDIGEPDGGDIERVSQLTFRTNQFNTSSKRRSTGELSQILDRQELQCRVVRVSDRFGDYGLVGVVLFRLNEGTLLVDTLLLSCRVLGRGVEHAIVGELGRIATSAGLKELRIPVTRSGKNQPVLDFFNSLSQQYNIETSDEFVLESKLAVDCRYEPAADVEYAELSINNSRGNAGAVLHPESSNWALVQKIAESYSTIDSVHSSVIEYSRIIPTKSPQGFRAPESKLQKQIADVWCTVLGVEKVGLDDNFFEIGGSSLKGVQLVSQLKSRYGIVVGIVDLFAAPTVQLLQQFVDGGNSSSTSEITKVSADRGEKRRLNKPVRRKRRS